MLLADFGAEVVKVEPPDGDPSRRGPGAAVYDRGKRSVALEDIDSLVRGADVVVTSDADRVHLLHPAAVVLHTPPCLGPTPWTGGNESDALISAWFGVPLRQGSFDGEPVDHIYPIVTTLQGIWAAACAVAALLERERSGRGQIVTVSGEHGVMIASAGALTFKNDDLEATRSTAGAAGGRIPFYRTYRCGDGGWLFFAALTPRFTQLGFEVLGLTELMDDPRLGGRGRAAIIAPEHSGWVTEVIAERFLTAPRDEWIARLRAVGCPSGAVLDRDDWLDHPQIDAVGMRVEVDDPRRGRVTMPGVPLRLGATPGRVRGPGSGASPDWEPRPTHDGDAGLAGPLAGVRVLDLGAIIAGPFAASLLGDLGADVIKVEPLTGDSFRGPGFAAYNKGQRGVALDLRRPEGHAAFLDLVQTADILVDNYRPGVLGRLGIEWETLHATNPNVISASITGFGEGGPFGDDAGFDPVLQAMSGMMRAQGGGDDPVFYTVPVNDVVGSAMLAFGSLVALFHRGRSGSAQKVTASLAAMSAFVQAEALVRFKDRPPADIGSRDHPGPSDLERFYRTSDGWVRIEASEEDSTKLQRIVESLSSLTRDDAVARLSEVGIPAVAARTMAEIVRDPRVLETGMLHRDPRPDRTGWTAGRHAHFSRTMRSGALVSPRLGEHTREVFAEIGYSAARIDELIATGAAAVD
jgi:crotonobetainyl-CoA:carnitine CoA-transferase CaiB-like acyl-CoA transferase